MTIQAVTNDNDPVPSDQIQLKYHTSSTAWPYYIIIIEERWRNDNEPHTSYLAILEERRRLPIHSWTLLLYYWIFRYSLVKWLLKKALLTVTIWLMRKRSVLANAYLALTLY